MGENAFNKGQNTHGNNARYDASGSVITPARDHRASLADKKISKTRNDLSPITL